MGVGIKKLQQKFQDLIWQFQKVPAIFVNTKEMAKYTKENYIRSFFDKIVVTYSVPSTHLSGHDSWSPDELKDTHIGKIACHANCTPDGLFMQFGQKLHASAIFCCMQFHRDGCLSTRLDFRNHVLRDERLGQNKKNIIFKEKKQTIFSFVFFKISFVFTKMAGTFWNCHIRSWNFLCSFLIPIPMTYWNRSKKFKKLIFMTHPNVYCIYWMHAKEL